MARKAKRKSKLIGFRAYFDDEGDILEWLSGVDAGHVSDVLKMAIRGYMTGYPVYPKPPEMFEVIQQQLDDLRAQIANGSFVSVGQANHPVELEFVEGGLTLDEVEQLQRTIGGASW